MGLDFVGVSASFFDDFDDASFVEFCEDILDGAFGDSDEPCEVADAESGIATETDEDVSVVGEEGPRGVCRGIFLFRCH